MHRNPASTVPSSTRPVAVDAFVDPICPFAWCTSRWLDAVGRCRPLQVHIRIMSLSVLNETREGLSDRYRELLDVGWGPARVAIAVEAEHGEEALRDWYTAFGQAAHVDGVGDYERATAQALAEAGIPASLVGAASSTRWDAALRASHQRGIAPVGDDIGTPILHIDGVGIFGPVLSYVPSDEDAVALFEATRTLAAFPGFSELKRSRTLDPNSNI